MGSESDFYTDTVEKMRMPSSFSSDGYVNIVSSMVSKGLEDMGESRSNALDLLNLAETHEVSIKEVHKNVVSEAQRVVVEEEQDDFPELSLLRGDCIVNFSNIGIEAEAEYMARLFNDGGDYNGCENSFPISLRLDDVGPLVNVDGDLAVQGEEFCSLPLPGSCTIASVMANSSSKEGRKESLSNIESYKSNFDNFNDNITNFGEKSIDDKHLQNDLGLPLQSSRKIRDTCQVNSVSSSSEIGTNHQKLVEEILGASHNDHEATCSAQGSTGEPAYCSTVEKSTSEMLSFTELYVDGSTFSSFKNSSTCRTIDNDFSTGEKILPGVIANSCSLTSVRRTNPKRAASLRSNLADEKSIPVIRSQSDRRKYRRKFGASTCVPFTIKMFNEVNRKIRSSHRKARHSVWGTVEGLFTIIKQRDDLIKPVSVLNSVGKSKSKKAERGVNRTKRTAAMKNKQSRLFSTKVHLSCQSIQPNILAAQPSLEYGIENIMPTDSHTGTSNTKVESKQNMAEKWYVTVRSNMREGQQEEKDLESTLTQETSSDCLLSDFHGVSSNVELDFAAETIDGKHASDPGNSPDSDVYNPIIDVGNLTFEGTCINKRGFTSNEDCQIQESKEDGLTSVASKFINPFVSHLPLLTRQTQACEIQRRNPMKGHKGKTKLKEKKENKLNMVNGENNGKKKKIGKRIGIHECPFLIKSDLSPGEERLDCQEKSINVKVASLSSSCSLDCQEACDKVDKCSKVSRTQSEIASDPDNLDFSLGITNSAVLVGGETVAVDALPKDASNDVATPVFSESAREPCNIFSGQSSFSGKKAWALCDDCQKWRCVPDELVYAIEKGRWTCKDNVDEAFADCTIPQEKSDEDINNDLGISNEQYCSTTMHDYGELAPPRLSAAARTTWTPIKSNMFLHRNRRTQTIDEIMVCHCKPPRVGGLGCGEECLNRMLNIECVKGTCPCGNLCSNQQFQKRKYAEFKWLKCGKKGYGLQLEHDASRGQFLIEYVGEVLDLAAYEARLRNYACRGQKHFYFMTLNGGEVIDACDKGNLGRFINHSCNPNCRTEKWMVNGEVCIGLFAIRDIKKGEEITFDYNYVRVFGAAAKKCVCGSTDCRGYIGGDPSSSEVIVQDDSDAEDVEPVMIQDVDVDLGVMGIDSVATDVKEANHKDSSVERNDTDENSSMLEQGACVKIHGLENQVPIHQSSDLDLSESLVQSESGNNMSDFSNIEPSQEVKLGLSSIETDQIFYEKINEGSRRSAIYRSLPHRELSESPEHSLNSSLQTNHTEHGPVLDDATNVSSQNSCSFMHKRSSATCPTKEILTASKPNSIVKTLRHIKVKRSRISIKSVASGKSKKVSSAISSRHIEGVEEKLNELLDEDGGICRKKDAAKGYLKLLVVTAASGDETKGSMSQSARDLSMILDAMLKTKSRMVLVDIINKNGLQMLHNMMKQNRDNFNRTPILRKLLKVLEFLAEKEILTVDHIYAAPPHSGMESFKESMLKLIKHRDTQVHLIARNFADQWIPRNFHRAEPSERDVRQSCTNYSRSNWSQSSNVINPVNCQPTSEAAFHGEARHLPTQAVSSSASFTDVAPIEMLKSRKRKTRWDQPSDANEQASQCLADQVMSIKLMRPSQLEPISDIEVPKQGSNNSSDEILADADDDGEMPPGFGSSDEVREATNVDTGIDGETVVIGHPQERYLAHLTVAYGMPVALMFDPSLKIAPAMPFKPFPPLPSYPRPQPCPPNTVRTTFNRNSSYRHDMDRVGFHRYGNGRRFFQPQQWNSQRPRRF